ncbi:U3 small nucleolar ribonucleoprotein protein MPP10 isoform X2 [Cloeon dipterum]
MIESIPFWQSIAEQLENLSSKPDKYLCTQPKIAAEIKTFTKKLYDSTKSSEKEAYPTSEALPELIINSFDDEQIWQQIELQNQDAYDNLVKKVSRLMAKQLTAKVLKEQEPTQSPEREDELIGENEENEDGYESVRKTTQNKKKLKPSIVDDKFFKLQDMEEFLLSQENEDVAQSDKELIDLFADNLGSDDEEEGQGVFYKDFFDAPEGEDDEGDLSEEIFDEEEEEDESNEEDGDSENGLDSKAEDEENQEVVSRKPQQNGKLQELMNTDEDYAEQVKDDGPKSSFEMRQDKLKKRIDKIHEEALGEKPWQLHGEISATTRPQNSLLEEVLEFDRTQRPAPVITEQTTIKLEDIIRQRIKDKAWDDVERKIKPVEEPIEYKKRLALDQSKSKMSLAEIYEQDYLKQKKEANADPNASEEEEKDSPEKVEIKTMLHSLFLKLDALSNYHYTPRPTAPEIKVISNLPAITVEEVAPAATSDATLLAPEEIKGKLRGNPLSKEERTDTDKNRERRKKKARQRAKRKVQEGKEIVGGGAKAAVKKAIKEGKVKQLEVADKNSVKSSKAFFTKLQDEVSSTINLKKQEMKRKNNEKSRVSAKKLKL